MKKKKLVYVGLSADILHEGHINILKTANKFGKVIVGLLTDQAIASYKNIPHNTLNKMCLKLSKTTCAKTYIIFANGTL